MADPRNNCPTLIERNSRLQTKKKGIFDAIGTLGKLEAFNELGGGRIREGLDVIAAVSDSVRAGKSVVPGRENTELFNTTIGGFANTAVESIENGANVVLDAVGIGRGALDSINNIDAGVANRALGSAKQIFQQAKQGNFSLSDIPSVFSNLQNLEILVRKIFTPTDLESSQINQLNKSLCRPSPWALDLVQRAPRNKFLYIVDIKFAPAYQTWNDKLANGLAFITKSSTRPQVDFEYEEVNMYNYWTKIPKRTIFNPITMRFIDDHSNNALNFYAAYMRAMSPITNKKFIDDRTTSGGTATHGTSGTYESDSMLFNETSDDQELFGRNLRSYSSSIGPLDNDTNGNPTKSLLSSISLYHIGNYGDSITAFHMFNPKITSLQPDDLDMTTSGDGSEFSFEFVYDSVFVDPGIPIETFGLDKLEQISGGSVGATYTMNTIPTPSSDGGGNNKQV
jgi:hypothetical protein